MTRPAGQEVIILVSLQVVRRSSAPDPSGPVPDRRCRQGTYLADYVGANPGWRGEYPKEIRPNTDGKLSKSPAASPLEATHRAGASGR
jgi:hypothetical protein